MSINRWKLWLALGLQLMFATVAWGQELPDYEWVPGVRDFQPFAPASDITSHYGSGPKRRKGWFFTIEDLAWSTSNPQRATIGDANYTPLVTSDGIGYYPQQNSLDTGFIQSRLRQGERLQLGYVGEDGIGWMVGTFVVHSSVSSGAASNAGVSFFSPFVNGTNETEGFIEQYITTAGTGTGGTGTSVIGFDKDINGNGIFGSSGRDAGLPNPNPPPAFLPTPAGFPTAPAPTDYGDLVQLPIYFSHVVTQYSTRIWGVEVMRTWWLGKNRRSDHGYWDCMAGVRYIRFRDSLYFLGEGYDQSVTLQPLGGTGTGGTATTTPGHVVSGLLSDTYFTQTADNNLVGPQVALRWFKERGRLSWNVEGRFMAAANFQNNRQVGAVATRPEAGLLHPNFTIFPQDNNVTAGQIVPQVVTPFLRSAGVNHTQHTTTWSPVGELRFNANYQIFRNVQATVGWTGLVMGGVGRSPNLVSYTLPDMGILNSGNRQVVFVQGINFGFNVNR